jgi:hypothetical protein
MPVAEAKRAFDGRAAVVTGHAEGAESQARQADALCLQTFHLKLH